MRFHIVVWILLLPLVVLTPLPAQDFGDGADIFGLFGHGRVTDDEGSLGGGVNFAGGLGYRISRRLGVEGEVAGFHHSRDISPGFGFEGSGALLLGNAVYYFSGGRVQPYLLGGAGLLHYRNALRSASGTGFAIDAGAGLKIFASRRVSIKPDFRIMAGSAGDAIESPFVNVRFAVGIGYHW